MNMLDVDNIRIDGGTQARSELSELVVAQYAEAISAGEKLPPVVTFFDGTDHWLADGFHRLFAHKKLELVEIDAEIHSGTRRDAVLYSVGANRKHGLPPSNADKRKAVELLLNDAEWSKWSQQKIASTCGVSAGFVSKLVGELASIHGEEIKPKVRTVERAGKTYEQNTAKIGKSAAESQPKAADKPATAQPKRTLQQTETSPQNDDELAEAHNTISDLAAENERLADRLAVEAMDASQEEKTAAAEIIADLRHQVKTLSAELDAMRISRDTFQAENSELMKQVQRNQRELKKLMATA